MAATIKEFQPEDAAAVARLWQASDAGWPDGFAYNVLPAPEEILTEVAEENNLNIYIAWLDGKAVGFANIVPQPDDDGAAYLGLLNSDPAYHGQGIGRDLVRRCIDRCVELGLKRLDLDTWQGNTKAVPLYKKTGFWWGPVQEELQNHMPLLLTHPLTKPYFDTTDWYACQKRDLQLGFDEPQRNGVWVFPYRWESELGALRAVFDQRQKKLVELDTSSLLLSLETDGPEFIRGKEAGVRLAITNRGAAPVSVAANASGDGPVKAEHFASVSVQPEQTNTLEFKASASGEDTGYGAVKLSVLVDGAAIEMATTLRVIAPLELTLEPATMCLTPDVPARVTLNARNRLAEPVEVELLPPTPEDIALSMTQRTLRLAAGEAAGVPAELRAAESGVHRLSIAATTITGETKAAHPPLAVDLVAAAPGEVYAIRQKSETLLVSDNITLRIPHKGREDKLLDRKTGRVLAQQWFAVGPPYWPSKLGETEFATSVSTQPGSASVTLRAALPEQTGAHLERILTLRADGRVTWQLSVINLGSEERRIAIRLHTMPVGGERAAYYPLAEGVVRGQGGQPAWGWHGPAAIPRFAERWVAFEMSDWTMGLFWPEEMSVRSLQESWMRFVLRGPELQLAPGESWSSGEIALLPTRAGWAEIERAWNERGGLPVSTSTPLPAAGARVVPSPVLLTATRQGDSVRASVEARSYHPRPCDGQVIATGSTGFTVEPATLNFEGLCSAGPEAQEITLRGQGLAREVGEINLDVRLPFASGQVTAPVIALGSPEAPDVSVTEAEDAGERVWRVENGWLSFGVRPQMLGLVYTLTTPDGELLFSSFPEPTARQWFYPVYGGIVPQLWDRGHAFPWDELGRLRGLTLAAEPTERDGAQGARWKGVRLSAALEHESLLGLRFELEYLTAPGSNVVAVRTAVTSEGPARSIEYRLATYPATEPESPLLLAPDQAVYARGGQRSEAELKGDRWVCAEYPTTGRCLVLVSALGDGVVGVDWGLGNVELQGVREAIVPAGGAVTACHYVIVAKNRRQAELYGSLADLKGL